MSRRRAVAAGGGRPAAGPAADGTDEAREQDERDDTECGDDCREVHGVPDPRPVVVTGGTTLRRAGGRGKGT
jgi:hypothetical protein